MKIYIIETGDYKKEVQANSLDEASLKAFKKYPPKNHSILTRCKEKFPIKQKRGDGTWHYIDTLVLLKKAGYLIK
jgi:hypothetical protein